MAPRSEEALRRPVRRHLKARGYSVRDEVRFNGRIADLVATGEDVVAVELKLADWRTAHTQAHAYQLGAHRAFVALPLAPALDVAHTKASAFERSGVGILGVDPPGDVRELVEARPSPRTLPFLAEGLSTGRIG